MGFEPTTPCLGSSFVAFYLVCPDLPVRAESLQKAYAHGIRDD